jgi:hypothetical protein
MARDRRGLCATTGANLQIADSITTCHPCATSGTRCLCHCLCHYWHGGLCHYVCHYWRRGVCHYWHGRCVYHRPSCPRHRATIRSHCSSPRIPRYCATIQPIAPIATTMTNRATCFNLPSFPSGKEGCYFGSGSPVVATAGERGAIRLTAGASLVVRPRAEYSSRFVSGSEIEARTRSPRCLTCAYFSISPT